MKGSKSEKNNQERSVQRGKRYSPGVREKILKDVEHLGVGGAARENGCTAWTIYSWLKKKRLEQEKDKLMPCIKKKEEMSKRGNQKAKDRDTAIIGMWRKHPGLGPSQIRNQLRRESGIKTSVNTVRSVMEEHGYVLPKVKRKEHTGSYEAVRPRHLYHLDFYHFYVHRLKQCVLFILDDYSRFISGWTMIAGEKADPVINTFEQTVARYGKPEIVMSDGGSAFHSWKGVGKYSRLLEEYGIDHWVTREAAVNGKVEALNGSFQKELIRQVEFADRDDALRQIGAWVRHYNFQRTHQALGGLLVPGDRFMGCVEETLRRIEEGQGGNPLDIISPQNRALELFRVISEGGSPKVYLMGQKILG
ncbi:MAG: DDE-type integrase/transposase/recombinase [Euryarchaeota archaeon]|nr:DDE-type integrase/transposase/recombinase [Euryarchaeota archaeon]